MAHGQAIVGQWDARADAVIVATNETARWESRPDTALGFMTDAWETSDGALRNTGGAGAFGLWLEEGAPGEPPDKTINAGVMVVCPSTLHPRATLLGGLSAVRLANAPDGGGEGEWDSTGAAEGARMWVNGVEDAPLASNTWQIVSFKLASGIPLHNAVVLGDPGLPEWRRTMDAAVRAVVLVGGGGEDGVSEAALRGVEHALAWRFGVPGIRPSTEAERRAALALRFNDHGLWRTVFMVR